MKRKLWALLVAVMMVATMVPAIAFAADGEDGNGATAGSEIVTTTEGADGTEVGDGDQGQPGDEGTVDQEGNGDEDVDGPDQAEYFIAVGLKWVNDKAADRPDSVKVTLTCKDDDTVYEFEMNAKEDESSADYWLCLCPVDESYDIEAGNYSVAVSIDGYNVKTDATMLQYIDEDTDYGWECEGFVITATKPGAATAPTTPADPSTTNPTTDKAATDKATQTGDDFNTWAFAGVGMLAAMAAAAVFFTRRQTQK